MAKKETANTTEKDKKNGTLNSLVGGDIISSTHTYIKDMAGVAFDSKRIVENARNETYEEAIDRLGVDDVNIYKVYKNYTIALYFCLLLAGICFIGCLSSLFISKNIFTALSFLAILLICLANSFRFSFRTFQIKKKRLCDVREWWDSASEWFPKL